MCQYFTSRITIRIKRHLIYFFNPLSTNVPNSKGKNVERKANNERKATCATIVFTGGLLEGKCNLHFEKEFSFGHGRDV